MRIGPRVLVVGTSGLGKSVLAARLARALGGPHIELDAFQHGPGWSQRSADELRRRTAAAIAGRSGSADRPIRRRPERASEAGWSHLEVVRLRQPGEAESLLSLAG